jgi:ketosteroid isomerase-like protein
MDNKELLTKFYSAFKKKDYKTMGECYHSEIVFNDPAFGTLKGKRASDMWEMLCVSGKDLTMEYSGIEANEETGKAHWEADYTFSATKRKVHNIIDASFEFKDGKIIRHTDSFSFKDWSRQAFGIFGVIIGGSSFLQKKFNKQANTLLDNYIAKQNGK